MTAGAPRAARRRRPPARRVALGALALFLVVYTLLAVQLANGRDPALLSATATAARHRPAVVQRVYVEPGEGDEGGDDDGGGAAPQTSPPAPAPAPLTTRAS
jgi:hypothetical protein